MSSQQQPRRQLTRAEVGRAPVTASQRLIIIHNRIYNVAAFLINHPGGESVIERYIGHDATGAFDAVGHSTYALRLLADLCVGELVPADRIVV